MARNSVLACLLTTLLSLPVAAESWAQQMFENTRHDFGTVARAARAEFRFELANRLSQDVHIAGVRTSCRCTESEIETPLLKTGEKGAIIARLNTRAFLGKRGATLTVTFDRPSYTQVQLHVSGYVRSDVVLHPGSATLGSVDAGSAAEEKLTVDYAGRSDWGIRGVTSSNPHLSGQVTEAHRAGGRVSYELTVRLDEHAPPGYYQDQLILVTNDRNLKEVPVPVEAVVKARVTVSPNSLNLGVLHPGQKVTKNVVVQGKAPFRILSVNCEGERFELEAPDNAEAKPVHLIPVTFVAGQQTGEVCGKIRIETDLEDAASELPAFAVVSP